MEDKAVMDFGVAHMKASQAPCLDDKGKQIKTHGQTKTQMSVENM